jgi:hypothetical protein
MAITEKSPLPQQQRVALSSGRKVLIGFAILIGVFGIALSVLCAVGLIRPFSVPTSAMAPAVARGDHVMMEGIAFLARKPRRGDIVPSKPMELSRCLPISCMSNASQASLASI